MKTVRIGWTEFDSKTQVEEEKEADVKLRGISSAEETQLFKYLKENGGNLESVDTDPYLNKLFFKKLTELSLVSEINLDKISGEAFNILKTEAMILWRPSTAKKAKSSEESEE